MRLHAGFMMDPMAAAGARIAFPPVPDAENAEVRRPPLPRTGNSPCAPNASAAPAERQGAERAGGRSAIKWKARGRSSAADAMGGGASGCACAHAGHASRTLFANATADTFLRSISNAEYTTAKYSYADILHCSLFTAHYGYCIYCYCRIFYADITYRRYYYRRYSLLQLYSHHILITSFPLTSSPPHSKLATALPHSLRKEIYKETGLPRPFSPPNEWLAPPQLRSPRSLRSFASLSSRM